MTSVRWEMSPRQVAAFERRIRKYQGLPLHKKLAKGTLLAAQGMVRPIRAEAPKGRTGNLRASVKARQAKGSTIVGVSFAQSRAYGGQVYRTLGALVGPAGRQGAHRHLVIRGHEMVGHKPWLVDTGQKTRPNDFVDRAERAHRADIVRIVSANLWDKP